MADIGIYRIRNLVNNHSYIGSSKELAKRRNLHFSYLKRNAHVNKHLQNAYNLYGIENFIFEVLEYISNQYDLLYFEQRYIDYYNDGNLYNLCKVAGSKLGFKATEETRAKLSIVSKGRNIGRKASPETKLNMSKAHKGRKPTFENRLSRLKANSKPVEQFNKNGDYIATYYSIAEAARVTGIPKSSIGYCCCKKLKHAGGQIFIYADNSKEINYVVR